MNIVIYGTAKQYAEDIYFEKENGNYCLNHL